MPIQPLRDIPLAPHTTFRLGGRARYFFEATTDDDVTAASHWATDARVSLYVLGGGSNLVISESGVSGLALKIATQGITSEFHGDTALVRVNAGVVWDDFVQFTVERDLVGVECLSGIPGCVGATPIQNVGAYGQEVAQTLKRVTVLDRSTHERRTIHAADCGLSYRDSRFKSGEPNRYVILNAEFELRRALPDPAQHRELATILAKGPRAVPTVQDVRNAVLALREQKSMLTPTEGGMRSAGSFFVNPIVDAATAATLRDREGSELPVYPQPDGRAKLSAAWLIEHSGWRRGQREGNVGLSPHHCLVLVAHARADADELVALAKRIRDSVRSRFDIELVPEPCFWGFDSLNHGLPDLEDAIPPTLGSAPLRCEG